MDDLRELYHCKESVERELKLVGVYKKNQYPKRFKPTTDPPSIAKTKFEKTLLRYKAKWGHYINAIFHDIHDHGVYDKLALDLAKSFNTFHSKYQFDDDQLYYAFRCLIVPVNSQIIQEEETGRRAHDRQERRKYFLLQVLSCGTDEREEETIPDRSRQATPSLDGSIDVCSENPITHHSLSNGTNITRCVRPTRVTIIVIDVLVDALVKLTGFITGDSGAGSGRERIFHLMNIYQVVDILVRYLNEVESQLREENQYGGLMQGLNLELIGESFERYRRKLAKAVDKIDHANAHMVFRSRLNLLCIQFTCIKAMIRM